MNKQQIVQHNLVNLDRLATANYPKSVFIKDWNLDEPEVGYFTTAGKEYRSYKYTCIVYLSDTSIYQFGFTNRNKLRNRIKYIQSINKNIVARIIVEVKHE